ncbi:MAG: hypothetical protein HY315_07445 [Acidobacteria bacterium]|nr:hypothetical protein [Acidobacteriota bacterium]
MRRRLKRSMFQFAILVLVVCAAALVLKLLFSLAAYAPAPFEPGRDDLERYLQQKRK